MTRVSRLLVFCYAASLIILSVLHNPFLGYENTSTPSYSSNAEKFDFKIEGCNDESFKVWQYYYKKADFLSQLSTAAQFDPKLDWRAELDRMKSRESPELREKAARSQQACVKPEHQYLPGEAKSFTVWQSKGAFVSWAETGLNLLILCGAATLMFVIAFLLFGRPLRGDA